MAKPAPHVRPLRLNGTKDDDILTGGALDDTINARQGNDTLDGGAGDDTLNGGDGDDTVIFSAGYDLFDGGAGFDTLDFSQASGQIIFEEGDPGSSEGLPEGYGVTIVTSVEHFIGSIYNDVFNVDFLDSGVIVEGGAGDDNITGGDGNDTLVGDADDDTLNGGAGDDWLVGVEGDDTLDGGSGDVDRALFYLNPNNVGTYTLVTTSDANKQLVTLVNGSTSEVIAEVVTAADGTITVTGIGASSYLGTDTLANVDRLVFSNVPADPFTNPVTGNYLAFDVPTYVSGLTETTGVFTPIDLFI